ncbi:MAG: cytochrome c [Bacteroidia bacterium]|nr:cytochrome c [Bacteroidia bacterium]
MPSHRTCSNFHPRCVILHALLAAAAVLLLSEYGAAQDAATFFRQNCMSCHSIGGGPLTGPDLKDVHKRREKEWTLSFMMDPKAMIDKGDATARQLLQEFRGVMMPTLPTVTRARAEELYALIEKESALEASEFKGVQVDDRPFTAADVAAGRKLFNGDVRLSNGAASCMSCHAVQGIGGLGGGTLGPDLTTVFERYQNRKNLSTWLAAPATPTMQAVFKQTPLTEGEIRSLVAYFENTLQRNPADTSTARLNFLLFGLGGVILVLGLFDVIWSKRFRSVRRALVERMRRRAGHDAV